MCNNAQTGGPFACYYLTALVQNYFFYNFTSFLLQAKASVFENRFACSQKNRKAEMIEIMEEER